MNPFTESTVARPLSEPRRQAANQTEAHGPQDATPALQPGARRPSREAKTRRPVRGPRSLRLARRRASAAIWRRRPGEFSIPVRSGPMKASILDGISRRCRQFSLALLATALAFGASAAWAVNVNSANVQELETITGIGPKTAQTIVEERNRGGSFESFDDLSERVKGIGPKKAKSLQAAGLVVGPGGSTPKAPVPAVQRKAGK